MQRTPPPTYLLTVFLPLLLVGIFAATPNGMSQSTIDFSKSTNLKAVYDAGLRPWRVRSDEISTLLITDQLVRVIAPNGKAFTISVEIGDFDVLSENQLSTADFISQPTSLEKALLLAKESCQALGINTTRGDGMGSIDDKAAEFASLGNQTPVPQFWNGRSEVNGIRYSVTLHPMFGYKETFAKVYVTLDFYQRGKPMKFLTEPIKPPPGYENVSMERPPRDPNQKPFPNPEYSFENMVKRVEAAKAAEGRSSTPTMTPSASAPTATPKPSPIVQAEPSKSTPWPWIIGAILFLAVAGGILLKLLRK
jgi:hypothetical protein